MAELITTSVASLLFSACADYTLTLPDTTSPIGPHQMELSHSYDKLCVLCICVCVYVTSYLEPQQRKRTTQLDG